MRNPPERLKTLAVAAAALLAAATAGAQNTSPSQELARWSAEAGRSGDGDRGRRFFEARHGGEWSCSSCHGSPPTREGKHANTGRAIAPLAPAFNPKALTDRARVDKWFRRNCKD
ncbi:MAG: DUF1924 domain-containing protein, partial [Casimicrobiaceae bacterium]